MIAGENEVWLARKVSDMKSVAKAVAKESFADQNLGLGIAAADSRHHPAAGSAVDDIGHRAIFTSGPAGLWPSSGRSSKEFALA